MITCAVCGREIAFLVAEGWQHKEEPVDHHGAVVSSKVSTPTEDLVLEQKGEEAAFFMRGYPYYAIEEHPHTPTRRAEIARLQHLFLSVYYHDPEVPWQEVRNHGKNHTCNCGPCTARCNVCRR